jgi:hypothetical protein
MIQAGLAQAIDEEGSLDKARDSLEKPERFILMLADIPALAERLDCWAFSLNFEERVNDIENSLEAIFHASKEIRESRSLKQAFALIISYGNHMNGNTPKGQADGFDIEFLPKLSGTKNSDGTMTIIDYLARALIKAYPNALEIKSEVKTLSTALAKSPIDELLGETAGISSTFKGVNAKSDIVFRASMGMRDKFEEKMAAFFERAETRIAALTKQAENTRQMYVKAHNYFGPGVKHKIRASSEFFELINGFVNELFIAIPKDKDAVASLTRKHKIGQKLGAGGGGEEGNMMSIINAIKSGGKGKREAKRLQPVQPVQHDEDGPPMPSAGDDDGPPPASAPRQSEGAGGPPQAARAALFRKPGGR